MKSFIHHTWNKLRYSEYIRLCGCSFKCQPCDSLATCPGCYTSRPVSARIASNPPATLKTIVRCPSLPCEISAPEECLWTDLMMEKQMYGRQANHYACIKRADGSCSWYRGVSSPKKEFLDADDP